MIRKAMESADLTFWPNLSLAIFFIFFMSIVIWTYRKGGKKYYEDISKKILDDDNIVEKLK